MSVCGMRGKRDATGDFVSRDAPESLDGGEKVFNR